MCTWYRSTVFFCLVFSVICQDKAIAQIIPDNTLGGESSSVNPINPNYDRIDGGAIRGSNLFHSFREFNIHEGNSAYFSNPEVIKTIFSRVTGNNPSLLLGKLGVLGNANLFFINPNGVIFGPNASLDISGSFVVTSAKSIRFPDGSEFSAVNPQGAPLLTIDVPVSVGLVFEGDTTGKIYNQADLQVGKHLSLIGETIVNEGSVIATQGDVTLISKTNGIVQLDTIGKYVESSSLTSTEKAIKTEENNSLENSAKTEEQSNLSRNSILTNKNHNSSLENPVSNSSSDVLTPKTGDILIMGSSDKPSILSQNLMINADNNLTIKDAKIGASKDLSLTAENTLRIRDSKERPVQIIGGQDLTLQGNQSVDIFALNNSNSGLVSGEDMIVRSENNVIGDTHYWTGGSFRVEKLDGSLGDLESPNDPIIRSQGDVNFSTYLGASLHILAGGSVKIGRVIITGTDTVGDTINPTSTPNLANVVLSNGESLTINGNQSPTLDIRAGVNQSVIGSPLGTIGIGNRDLFLPSIPTNNSTITNADITIGEIIIFPVNGVVFLTTQYQPNLSLTGGNINVTGEGSLFKAGIENQGSVILDSRNNINTKNSPLNTSSVSGDGGNITLLARGDININSPITSNSSAFNGNGGNILIEAAKNVNLNASLDSSSNLGNGGSVLIESGNDIILKSDIKFSTKTNDLFGGDISLNADNNIIVNSNVDISSIALIGGNITFEAGNNISIESNSSIDSSGFIGGNISFASNGNISIATSIIKSENQENDFNLDGKGGAINIESNSILIKNNSQIYTQTFSTLNAGDININAIDTVEILNNNQVASNVGTQDARGNGGNINIISKILELDNSSALITNTSGIGDGGNFNIFVDKSLQISKGSQIITSTSGTGNAGNIIIQSPSEISLFASNNLIHSSAEAGSTGNAGNIDIKTQSLSVQNGGQIISIVREADNKKNLPSGRGNAGNINITASDSIILQGINTNGEGSLIQSRSRGKGNSGDLSIETGSLSLQNGGVISTRTANEGKAGNINIKATDSITLQGRTSKNISSIITSLSSGQGDAGNLKIETGTLSLQDGASITTYTTNKGKGGNLTIIAPESITLEGKNFNNINQGSTISSGTGGSGNAGNLRIETGILSLKDGASIDTGVIGTISKGKGGNLTVIATDSILLQGTNDSGLGSFITSESGGKGDAGDLILETNVLSLKDGAYITTGTLNEGKGGNLTIIAADSITLEGTNKLLNGGGSLISSASQGNTFSGSQTGGDSGDIRIETRSLSLKNGASISTLTSNNPFTGALNTGNAGNINIIASDFITLQGLSGDGIGSSITTNSSTVGNAGDLSLKTSTLSLQDGAYINTTTSNIGKGGDITIIAPNSITLQGKSGNGNSSIIFSGTIGKGDSGNLRIETGILSLQDSSHILTNTVGEGNAGSIIIDAKDLITLKGRNIQGLGSSIRTGTGGLGNANNIILNTPQLNLSDGARLSALTSGKGNAGDIIVNSTIAVNIGNNSQLTVETSGAGKPGHIDITTNTLNIGTDAQLSATTTATATNRETGGSINLNANQINLSGKLGIFAETQGVAPAGDLTIKPNNTQNLDINFTDNGFISARTFASGQGGDIEINAPQTIDIRGQGKITVETQGSGNAGNITLSSQNINLADGLEIAASTTRTGSAGNINLNANQINLQQTSVNAVTNSSGNAGSISLSHQGNNAKIINLENSQISTEIQKNGQATRPSNIDIKTDRLTLNNSTITASTQGKGDAGNITVPNAQNINLNQSEITASTSGEGNAGDINLKTETLNLNNQSQITSTANRRATGDGGDITLQTRNLALNNASQISTSTQGEDTADAGKIAVTAENITLDNNSQIAATTNAGKGGTINLSANTLDVSNSSQIRTTTTGKNNAGDITAIIRDNITLSGTNSGFFADTGLNSLGKGGNIFINPIQFIIKQGAAVSVNSRGQGIGGNIFIGANNLTLDNGTIFAQTFSTTGGNITLRISDILLMRNGSQISTTAGTTNAGGNGGNITINAKLILTNLYDNNRITANAFTGNGGNINITSRTIFGFVVGAAL
ncbi:two-partner secretion domain-containing protein, partial [Aphanothece sacrum]